MQLVKGRRVKVRCYARDQYGRVVGSLSYGPPLVRRDLSSEMVKAGLGAIYRGSGACYGAHNLAWWERLETKAQEARLGMWVNGVDKAQLPSDFKKASKSPKKPPK